MESEGEESRKYDVAAIAWIPRRAMRRLLLRLLGLAVAVAPAAVVLGDMPIDVDI